mmetsp:Transcript_17826/g.17061  ORF Transcript_17826/g.17061 Transcript_17826/m.17061 type:complete len:234 (-) Transcript_17826:498-1199(-)
MDKDLFLEVEDSILRLVGGLLELHGRSFLFLLLLPSAHLLLLYGFGELSELIFVVVLALVIDFVQVALLSELPLVEGQLFLNVPSHLLREEKALSDHCLVVPHVHMELALRLHLVWEVRDFLDDCHQDGSRGHGEGWGDSDASFDQGGVELGQADADPVSLLGHLDRLPEHLHRFDFLLDLVGGQLDGISDLDGAFQDGACENSALPLHLEAVIYREQEGPCLRPLGHRNRVQ